MVFFPELFSNHIDKFGRFTIWLITRESVVCPNTRNMFSAGGKGEVVVENNVYSNVPRIFLNLFDNFDSIIETIVLTSHTELSEYWGKKTTERGKVLDWFDLVDVNSKSISDAKHLEIKEIMIKLIK